MFNKDITFVLYSFIYLFIYVFFVTIFGLSNKMSNYTSYGVYSADVTPANHNGKVIFFIYGYYSNGDSIQTLFTERGYRFVCKPHARTDLGQVYNGSLSFAQILQNQLYFYNNLINSGVSASDIILVGHSYGGLLAYSLFGSLLDFQKPSQVLLISPMLKVKDYDLNARALNTLASVPLSSFLLGGVLKLPIYPIGLTSSLVYNNPSLVLDVPTTTGIYTMVTAIRQSQLLSFTPIVSDKISVICGQQDRLIQIPSWFLNDINYIRGSHEPWVTNLNEFSTALDAILPVFE